MKTVLILLVLLAAQGILSLHGQEAGHSAPVKIELPGEVDYRYAGFIAAQEKGFFKEAGFDVELSFGSSKEDIKQRILKGDSSFSVCGSEIALDSSGTLIATAAFFQRTQTVLVLKKEGNSTWLKNKAGYKIVFEREKPIEILTMFRKQEMSVDDFDISYDTKDKIERFEKGEIDGFEANYLTDNFDLKFVKRPYHVYNPEHFGAELYDQVLYTGKDFYAGFSEVSAFNKAVADGWEYALGNRDEVIGFLVDKYQFKGHKDLLPHQHWTVENRLILPNLVKIGYMKESRWDNIQKTYIRNGLLEEGNVPKGFFHIKEKYKRGFFSTYYLEVSVAGGLIFIILLAMLIFNRKLVNMVNKRTGELAEVNWQLSKFNEELEEKIQERTEALEKALKEAEVASKAKSTFLANMTHEIRTPMNSILGFAQIMKEKSSDPDMKKYLETINTSGQSLLRIINDVLDISRVESGKFTLDYSRFNILRLIEETLSLFSEEVQSKNLTLKFDHSDECPEYIYLDKDRLRQVLVNIIGNAIKFTEEGLIEVKLSLEMVGPKEANVKIIVKDTGIGIPKENLDSIFGEFEQVDNIHLHYGGTGLGLAISRRIVTMLKGELTVQSELGRGSDFSVLLKNVGIVDQADEKEENKKVQYYFEPAKVMIVDNCLATRELFEAYLSVTRLTVRTYETAFDAVKDLEEFVPNLIITEINLRSMDGFQLAEEIRTIEGYKKIPIIAVSSITHTGSRQKFRIFNGFLKKPISVNEFYQSISHFLPCRKINKNPEVKKVLSERCKLPQQGKHFSTYIDKGIRDKCTEIMKYQVINDYKNLAKTLASLAEDEQLPDLKAWLEEFQKNLDVFNFSALNRQLEYLMNSKAKKLS